jgi:hypothetical protein
VEGFILVLEDDRELLESEGIIDRGGEPCMTSLIKLSSYRVKWALLTKLIPDTTVYAHSNQCCARSGLAYIAVQERSHLERLRAARHLVYRED